MQKSSLKTLVLFPALSLVVAAGCVSSESSTTTSLGDTTSSVDSGANVSDDSQAPSDSSVVPKGSDPAGSSNVDSNAAQVPDSTTGTQQVTRPTESQGQSTTSGAVLALTVLERIRVENEVGAGYSRDLFRHWIDADGDRCNTREEVLIAESTTRAQVDAFGCTVIAGDWFSPFDGKAHTDPSDLDIDHLVALKEAWDSGAHSWPLSQRERFANDLSDGRALIAVTSGVNRSKADRDPSQWLPPRSAYICTYVSDWVAVKYQWSLSMDSSEWGRLKNLLNGQCAGTTISPWETVFTVQPPSQSPTSQAPSDEPVNDTPALPTIRPGAFCTPEGALGTYSAKVYLCAKTRTSGEPYGDGRARWRQQ